MNPQRTAFKENYCNPESDTFGNIRQSAMKAGFEESYANVIMADSTGNEWVKEIIKDYNMLSKAESNLNKLLDETDDIKVRADITKFVAKTLGKNKYSERQEITGKDGGDLKVNVINYGDNDTIQVPTENVPDTTTESNG